MKSSTGTRGKGKSSAHPNRGYSQPLPHSDYAKALDACQTSIRMLSKELSSIKAELASIRAQNRQLSILVDSKMIGEPEL